MSIETRQKRRRASFPPISTLLFIERETTIGQIFHHCNGPTYFFISTYSERAARQDQGFSQRQRQKNQKAALSSKLVILKQYYSLITSCRKLKKFHRVASLIKTISPTQTHFFPAAISSKTLTFLSTLSIFSFHPLSILLNASSKFDSIASDRFNVSSAASSRIPNSAALECRVANSARRVVSAGRWDEMPSSSTS